MTRDIGSNWIGSMRSPKILVFAGSIRTSSFNARLAALAAKELALLNIDVTRISLVDSAAAL
jgi:chromate reductase